MKLIFTISLICIVNFTYAQHEFGAKVNLGISVLSFEYAKKNTSFDKTVPLLSGSMGISYEFKSEKLIGFETAILFSQLNTRLKNSNEEPSQGCVYCTGTTEYRITYLLSYLYIPTYLKFNFEKIGIGVGVRTGFNLIANRKVHITGETLGEPYEIGPTTSKYDLKTLDFGPTLNLEYSINDRILVNLNAYSSAMLVQHKTFGDQFFNYQFTGGIHYKFVKN